MQVSQRAWVLQRVQAGASKSAGTAGHVGSAKSVGAAGHAGTPQVADTATTSTRSALAASPGSTGIKKKGCKSARTSRKRRVSLLACRQYRRGTSAQGDGIRIGIVSIRNHPQLDSYPLSFPPSLGVELHSPLTNSSGSSNGAGSPSSS